MRHPVSTRRVGPASAGQCVANDDEPPEGGPTERLAATSAATPMIAIDGCATT